MNWCREREPRKAGCGTGWFRALGKQGLVQGLEGQDEHHLAGRRESIPDRRKKEGKSTAPRVRQGVVELECGEGG